MFICKSYLLFSVPSRHLGRVNTVKTSAHKSLGNILSDLYHLVIIFFSVSLCVASLSINVYSLKAMIFLHHLSGLEIGRSKDIPDFQVDFHEKIELQL